MMKIQAVADTECYRDYWLLSIRDVESGNVLEFEQYPGKPLDIMGIRMALAVRTVHGFNWMGYDDPMVSAALAGADCPTLKAYNDAIIVGRMKQWDFFQQYQIARVQYDWVDMMEVAPGVRISQKMYAGRMHSQQMQDLPIEPSASIRPHDRPVLRSYCRNDLAVAADMLKALHERLDLRVSIGAQYGIDVRSKSDAQIAEAVIKAQLNFKPVKQQLPHGHQFYFKAPDWVRFKTPQLSNLLHLLQTTPFTVNDVDQIKRHPDEEIYDLDGKKVKTGLVIPSVIKGMDIAIGEGVYRIGIGGLHSQEAKRGIFSTDTHLLTDHDVRSYYPTLILLAGMFPPAIGVEFLRIYRQIYDHRLHAKSMADEAKKALRGLAKGTPQYDAKSAELKHWKTVADSLKITLNGAFGKLGSKYSILFAPELLIQTTISGQLALLMLIETMELEGIAVMSANTDGIILNTPRERIAERDRMIADWERDTGLETEATEYLAVFNRSVNDYVAITSTGDVKRKGATFAKPGLLENKHPDREICADAVVDYLAHGKRVEDTVRGCTDIRKFLRVRQVDGGALWSNTGEYLGKAVRWYWGNDPTSRILTAKAGAQVAESEGAVPTMKLPEAFPDDLNYDYYIQECYNILYETGVAYRREWRPMPEHA